MSSASFSRSVRIALALALAGVGGVVLAQGGGADQRGAGDGSGSFEVGGIDVDVAGANADAARLGGWRVAQRKGWSMLSQRLTGHGGSLSDSALDALVTGIVIENEQIGPKRYVARLGVTYDRGRTAAILGVAGQFNRSQAMLLIPVQWSGGTGRAFEGNSAWQQAWTRFRTGNSAIDYVRGNGTGPDSLLMNAGQIGRRGRGWWRNVVDQYGATDILVPEVWIRRSWPGGPIVGTFRAGHGPDNREIARFTLRVNSGSLNALLDAGVRRIDQAYQDALSAGRLPVDRMLAYTPPPPVVEEGPVEPTDALSNVMDAVLAEANAITVQFDTPNVPAMSATEAAMRTVPGVRTAATTSLALGGLSVMRVTYDGPVANLRAALEARGWDVQEGGGALRITRRSTPRLDAPVNDPSGAVTPRPQ